MDETYMLLVKEKKNSNLDEPPIKIFKKMIEIYLNNIRLILFIGL
jgi:hypothetical protein